MGMKGLSLWQPYATLVAIGAKKIETRSWGTDYRGPLAIHATRAFPPEAQTLCYGPPFEAALAQAGFDSRGSKDTHEVLPRGCIVAVTRVLNCERTQDVLPRISNDEWLFGDYTAGRWAWQLDAVRALREPIPCRGAIGLWTLPPDVLALLAAQGMGQ